MNEQETRAIIENFCQKNKVTHFETFSKNKKQLNCFFCQTETESEHHRQGQN